ncbi:MAG TPA: pyruvate, phosphate dikinase [Pirellulaceae bacterium]|jgi:pyruvate,orthophosphate dikinase|nr:pyruvate, phosphate dikinase [Pirellulaceae bacterium]
MAKKSSVELYYFGKTRTDRNGPDGKPVGKDILGGKGLNLAEMTSIGLPVPPGFTIPTTVCDAYYKNGKKLPPAMMEGVAEQIATLEKELGKKFGDSKNPLLVSVRSGAAVSMPGMMNTILNLGLTDESVKGLFGAGERFAYDSYRRLINMFGDVVMEVGHHHYEAEFAKIKKKYKVDVDTDVPTEGMKELCEAYKKVYKHATGEDFPQDPMVQLERAIEAVFKSWMQNRAVRYREIEGIRGLLGTAVNVQSMVYGNMGDDSATGVAFTRDPSTGKNEFWGEFLINAQGEDVVAGIRTGIPVAQMAKWNKRSHQELLDIKNKLESHYKDVQDIEFTVEKGVLFMLQTRSGKRNGIAAVKIAVDMVNEKLIDKETALLRVPAGDLIQCMLPSFESGDKKKATMIAKGLPASPGAAVGYPVFSAAEAVKFVEGEQKKVDEAAQGGTKYKARKCILVRTETSPEDIDGMHVAEGILTSTGGMTSHAAVVARGWGRCCVAGAGDVSIDEKAGKFAVGGKSYTGKDVISIDGATGEVMLGEVPRKEPKLSGDFKQIMDWSNEYRRLGVRTNADTPEDAKRAVEFGAEGIGLCRTEHMFFEEDRISSMREMILAENLADRQKALTKLLPHQRKDFEGIFKAMAGKPVTIRLLDPPLHEFLPHDAKAQKELAETLGVKPQQIAARVKQLHESNPMLGHRGCRLSVSYPEILVMQVTAIVEAAINMQKKGIEVLPEIMIPLVGTRAELTLLRAKTQETIDAVKAAKKFEGTLDVKIGTMIEVPRAALTADEIAKDADFFSFGTNDLTQMTFGFSRDDINSFLPSYRKLDLLHEDPFASLDQSGVGQLVAMGVQKGRKTKKDLKVGICGEHGGDPASVAFCESVGLDYVSCSPFRVPTARLAAAQAAIRGKKK